MKRNREQRHLLPKSGGRRLPILAVAEPTDLSVEAIRSLRTSLHFAMMEAKNNILMVSGASPESGKSFTSTNLAVVVAQAGQRVLLIDADMRKGFLHRWLADDGHQGLSDLLVGNVMAEQAVRKTAIANLDFVPRGGTAEPVRTADAPPFRRFSALGRAKLRSGTDRYAADSGGDGCGDRRQSRRHLAAGGAF